MNSIARKKHNRSAFTLIEMMVVVAIIGLLLAALLPAFGTVRLKAQIAQATAVFKGIDTGIVTYQAESALGGSLPPSSTDNPDNRQIIKNPDSKADSGDVRITGAQLLSIALVGADGLGTTGFKDVNNDGRWWNDVHNEVGGLYELNETTLRPNYPRYGGSGYVDEKIRTNMKSLQQLEDKGVIQNLSEPSGDIAKNVQMFIDPWDTPILYYRANKSSRRMIASKQAPGIYRQEDNGVITGTRDGAADDPGLDFGAGKVDDNYHNIASAKSPTAADKVDDVLTNTNFDRTMARYILDKSLRALPTPVNRDSYLLISAGPDSIYGTDDDIINWERRETQ